MEKCIRTFMGRRVLFTGILFSMLYAASNVSPAQEGGGPIRFAKRMEITVTNPLDRDRHDEPIVIPLSSLRRYAPDFNPRFYRVKYNSGWFEPLDIPSQVRAVPWAEGDAEELVFQLDLAPNGTKTVELWYNPDGAVSPEYTAKTRSFGKWYSDGSNVAWENEVIAYRSYNGIVDFFGKSHPHLRLHDLAPDSYHQERFWGLDPYVVGKKPGLGGVFLFIGGNRFKCYGAGDDGYSRVYNHKAYGGGPVCAGAVVDVVNDGEVLLEEVYSLYSGRYENHVRTAVNRKHAGEALVAPGMQKFGDDATVVDEKEGYMLFYGSPVEEYGCIGTAIVWRTGDSRGVFETGDGVFVKLKPDSGGAVEYLTLAVWNRGGAGEPEPGGVFTGYVRGLAREFANPVRIEFGKVKD